MGKGTFKDRLTLKNVLWVAGGIVLLALVIFGVAAISAPKKTTPPETIQLTPEQQAGQLAVQAEMAASKDDTATARTLAEQAIRIDAANETAKAVIRKLDEQAAAAKKPASKPTTSAPVTPAADDPYVVGVKDVKVLLPGDIAGWEKGTVSAQEGEGLVTYEPAPGNAAGSTTVRVTFAVHDFKDGAKASAFSNETMKRVYSKDGGQVTIGTATAYTGSDGGRLAVVTFPRGRYAFEVLVNGQPGVPAPELKAVAAKLATSLPAAQ